MKKIEQHLINAQHLNAAASDLDRKRMTVVGAFNFSKNIYEWVIQNMPIEAKNTNLSGFLGVADRLESLGVDDQICASISDLAGEVLWDERLFWLDRQPKASIYDDCVRLDFSVDVSAKKAAELSWTLGGKVIDRNMDHIPFFISFRGVEA